MGFIKDIEDMPNQFEYSKTFFSRWYRPEYATVIVAGDVDPEEAFRLVEKYFGGWKRGAHSVAVPAEPPAEGPVYAHVPWPSDTLPWVTVAFHGPAFSETKKDLPAIDTLFDLSFGPTSDLYKKLVEKEQKLDGLFPNVGINEDPELVGVFARLKKGTDPVYVRDEILRTLASAEERARRPEAPRGSQVERAVRPRADARQHGDDRVDPRALRAPAGGPTAR